ncbi:DUF2306 domain-containing protein [Pseudokineococcus marinus]|uniref:DUF2306 domain-containing protein n=1 Tax=Pseudokineococcus marinus TaxID=351215 RepID=A0A849BL56_9ACTN|nr:DUF2306 domain-containing protein [Pseudokineococcus marinus]NNH23381.1 DUF2306 domain-containing protein [Pseudokineococcus marinus]
MDLHTALLVPHVVAGGAGLLLGPVVMALPKRRDRHGLAGRVYVPVTVVMTTTALALAALDPGRLWGLAIIAAATLTTALAGAALARRRPPGWLAAHVRLMGASYLSFVTAFLLTQWSSPLAWVLPTLVGTPLIALAVHRLPPAARRGGRPRSAPAPAAAAAAPEG